MNTKQHQVRSTQMDMHSNPNPNLTQHPTQSTSHNQTRALADTNEYELLTHYAYVRTVCAQSKRKRMLTGCRGNRESAWTGRGRQEKKRNEQTRSGESPRIAWGGCEGNWGLQECCPTASWSEAPETPRSSCSCSDSSFSCFRLIPRVRNRSVFYRTSRFHSFGKERSEPSDEYYICVGEGKLRS